MHKKFDINPTKIKGGCQSGRKVVPHNSKSDLPLGYLEHVTGSPSWPWTFHNVIKRTQDELALLSYFKTHFMIFIVFIFLFTG